MSWIRSSIHGHYYTAYAHMKPSLCLKYIKFYLVIIFKISFIKFILLSLWSFQWYHLPFLHFLLLSHLMLFLQFLCFLRYYSFKVFPLFFKNSGTGIILHLMYKIVCPVKNVPLPERFSSYFSQVWAGCVSALPRWLLCISILYFTERLLDV